MTDPVHPSAPASLVIPVISESVVVTREVETAGEVRVRIKASSTTQQVPVQHAVQQAHIERIAVGRPCVEREPPRYEADVLVVPVYEEVVVVSRQLVLKEELRISLTSSASSAVETVELLKEEAIVERRQPDGSWTELQASR